MKNTTRRGSYHKGVRLGVALTTVASLIIGGIFVFIAPALAAHTATVTASPNIVAGSSTNTYSFSITNNAGSPNSIYLIEITAPAGFTVNGNPTCPTGWTSGSTASKGTCTGDPDPAVNLVMSPGTEKIITLSVISSAPGADTVTAWTVSTKDNAFATTINNPAVTVDVTAPETTDNAEGGWLNTSPATITLSADDSTAGIAATYYTLDGSDPTVTSTSVLYIGPFEIAVEGTSTLKYFSIDTVGNAETVVIKTISIDITTPDIFSVDITLPAGKTAVKEGDNIIISADVTDDTSGVAAVTVDLSVLGGDDDFALNLDGESYTNNFQIPDGSIADGVKTIAVTAIDNAGNSLTNSSSSIIFDNTAPASSDLAIETLEGVNAVRSNSNIVISGTVTDDTTISIVEGGAVLRQYDEFQEEIGGAPVTITLDGSTFSGIVNVGELDQNTVAIVITVQVVDEALNASVLASSPLEVDLNSADLISATLYPPQELYAQTKVKDTDTVEVRVVTNDNTANEVTIDASAFGASNNISLNPDGSGTDFVGTFTVDSLGANITSSTLVTVRRTNNGTTATGYSDPLTIDNTDPTFSSITATPNPAKAGTVTITFTASETLLVNPEVYVNGLQATFNSLNGLDYSYTYTVADNNEQLTAEITITGFDEAANQGTDESASFTIDTRKPEVATVSSDGARFNAGVKTISVTFSEEISTTFVPQIAIAYSNATGVCNNIDPTDMTRVNSITHYTYDLTIEGTCEAATATITLSTATDLAGNEMIPNDDHFFTVDTVAPTFLSATTADTDNNGQIDTIIVTFNEDLNEETVETTDFTVDGGNYAVTNAVEGDAGVVTLTLTESGTPDTGETPLVEIAIESTIADIAGNVMTSGDVTPTDGAAPVLISAETTGVTTITAIFSEDLDDASVTAADFEVTDNTVMNAIEEVDGVVTLTLGIPIGTGDTPAVSVLENAVEDSSANANVAKSVEPTDGIAPVVISVMLLPESPVKAEEITFTIIFSEPMDELTAPTVIYDTGANPQDIAGSFLDSTTWQGTATIPSDDAANYDGTATISISGAEDDALVGNAMVEDTSGNFVIDTTPPGTPTINPVTTPTSLNTQTLTGTKDENTAILINDFEVVPLDGSTTWSAEVSLDNEGNNNFNVSTKDEAGNVSAAPALAEIVRDINPPASPEISTMSQAINTSTTIITGTAEADSTVTITGGVSPVTGTATGGNFSIVVTLNPNTLNTLSVTATDAAGNESGYSIVEITHDNIAPVAIFATSTLPVGLTNATSATISVTNGDVVAYKYKLDDGLYGLETPVATDITLTLTEVAHTLSIIGRDAAGNWQIEGNATTYSWTVDVTPPTLSSVTIASNNSNASLAKVGDTITLSFTADDDITTPTVLIAGNTAVVTGGPIVWNATTTLGGVEATGTIAFTINFTDIAGNSGTAVIGTTDGSSVTFDKTAPTVNITNPLTGTRVNGNALISFNNDETTAPECSVDGNNWTPCASENITLSGLFGFDALLEGAFTLYLRDTDPAGNTGNDSEIGIIKDTAAPTVSSHIPAVNAVGANPATDITIIFNESVVISEGNVTVQVQTGWEPPVETTVTFDSGTNTATISPTIALTDNTSYQVSLSGVKDEAGNEMGWYGWQFVTAAGYSITVSNGWNLISIPVVPNDTNIATVLGELLNDATKIESVFAYDSATDTWSVYHPGSPETSDLSTLTAGYGYWISYIAENNGIIEGVGTLFAEGNNVPPERQLFAGWNLIGYYQIENTTAVPAQYALATLTDDIYDESQKWWTQLRTYNNVAKQFSTVTFYDDLNPGEGFWIFMKSSSFAPYLYGPGIESNS